ncbi:MAG TPA: PIN domain-containing protein [Planctomycetota bacterium]|nr:PIN domain-containing protein [Planctomycetota bacterium]
MIYLDSSVALAHLLAEDRAPSQKLWTGSPVSSRLLEYEVWTRVHARELARTHEEAIRALFARVAFLDLSTAVLERALEPFPVPVRTLDALHLASVEFLRRNGQKVELATYDARQAAVARRMGIPLFSL